MLITQYTKAFTISSIVIHILVQPGSFHGLTEKIISSVMNSLT
jgi:hypothetical protein